MDDEIKIKVKTLRGGQKDFELTVIKSITIPELKTKLEEITSVPPSQQRLIYLGKVLKDEDKLSDYQIKEGGTLHMVARPQQDAPPASNNQPAANPSPPTHNQPNPSIPFRPPGGSSIVVGVVGQPNTFSEIFNSGNQAQPNSPPQPFQQLQQNLNTLETKLDNLLQTPATRPSFNAPPSNSVENFGQLIERASSATAQVLPQVNQVSSQLQSESTLQADRANLQQTISRLVPVLQQLGLTFNQLAATLGTVRLGEAPGQATVAENIGTGPRIAVHVSADGSLRSGVPPNINTGSPAQPQDPSNPNQPATPPNQQQQNPLDAILSQIFGGPPPNPSAAPGAAPGGAPNPNQPPNPLSAILNSVVSSLNPNNQNQQNQNQANPFSSMLNQVVSSLNQQQGRNVPNQARPQSQPSQPQGAQPQQSAAPSQPQQRAQSNPQARFSPLSMFLSGYDMNLPINQILNLNSSDTNEFVYFLATHLPLRTLIEIQSGDLSSFDTIHPEFKKFITENYLSQPGATPELVVKSVVQSLASELHEDTLPESIRNQTLPGCNLTQTFLLSVEEFLLELIKGTIDESREGLFSEFIRELAVDTVGNLINRLASSLRGGTPAAIDLVQLFLSQRLTLYNPIFGPMAAMMFTPVVQLLYNKFLQKNQNRSAPAQQPAPSQSVPTQPSPSQSVPSQPAPSQPASKQSAGVAKELTEEDIEKIINEDKIKQNKMRPQAPFSDAYIQAVPIMKRPRALENNDLASPTNLLANRVSQAINTSGISSLEPSEVQSALTNNPELTQAYIEQLRADLRNRIENDPDYDPARYPEAENFCKQNKQ